MRKNQPQMNQSSESRKSELAEGRTVEEAAAAALRQLGVEREQAEIEILSQPTKGFLGIGGKRARVRASLRAPSSPSSTAGERRGKSAPAQKGPRKPKDGPARRETRQKSPQIQPADSPDWQEDTEQKSSVRSEKSGESAGDPYVLSGRAVTAYSPEPVRESDRDAAPSPEFIEQACQLLQEILAHMDMEADVSSSVHNNEVVLNFEDVSDGLLIGRKGQTLDALEYVLNRILTRHDTTEKTRGREDEMSFAHVLLDAAGYRERRRQNLESLAMRLGERAKRRRRTVTLSPLNPRDRRVIHLALEGDPLVTTQSLDRGYLRRLSIVPEARPRRASVG